MLRPVQDWIIRKRDRRVVPFDVTRIQNAIANAFRAELNLAAQQPLDDDVKADIAAAVKAVLDDAASLASQPDGIDVERIQDLVEMELMSRGHYRVARRYIIYRAEHAKMRTIRGESQVADAPLTVHLVQEDRTRVVFDPQRISKAPYGGGAGIGIGRLHRRAGRRRDALRVRRHLGAGGVSRRILAARSRIERDPAYDVVAARLMLNVIYQEASAKPRMRNLSNRSTTIASSITSSTAFAPDD